RLPPRAATPTVCPYTTLFRSSGQCAKRAGDEIDRFGFVEVADNGEFQRPLIETVADVALQFSEAQGHVGFLGLQREARIAVGDRSEEQTSELESSGNLVCRLL